MVRAYKLFTNAEGNTDVQRGTMALGQLMDAKSILFKEDPPRSFSGFHDAPTPQFVLILSGTLECTTKTGVRFTVSPGEVMIADDVNGTGHTWKLVDDQPWRRAYVVFEDVSKLSFVADPAA